MPDYILFLKRPEIFLPFYRHFRESGVELGKMRFSV